MVKRDDERSGRMQSAATLVPKVTRRALGRRGFSVAAVVTDWPVIVGEALAAETTPRRLAFPVGQRTEGSLHIRATGPLALELQHLAPQVIERINGYFGFQAVARLMIHHGPAPYREERRWPAPGRVDAAALEEKLRGVAEGEMRDALQRLGQAVLAKD